MISPLFNNKFKIELRLHSITIALSDYVPFPTLSGLVLSLSTIFAYSILSGSISYANHSYRLGYSITTHIYTNVPVCIVFSQPNTQSLGSNRMHYIHINVYSIRTLSLLTAVPVFH